MNNIKDLQGVLNRFGLKLNPDGIVGPRTRAALQCACHMFVSEEILTGAPRNAAGEIMCGGRASTFGGATDVTDRIYDNAFLPAPAGRSPRQYATDPGVSVAWPYIRRAEMMSIDAWPIVGGRKVGLSYFLDTATSYCALPISGWLRTLARSDSGLYVEAISAADPSIREKCRVVDWGPAIVLNGKAWWAGIDLSPGVYSRLRLSWERDHVFWRFLID